MSVVLMLTCWPGAWTASQQPPRSVHLVQPNGVALDAQGNLYISDIGSHRVFKLTAGGQLAVVAGTATGGFGGDGGPATEAHLFAPHAVAFDSDGRLLIADTFNHRIRRVDERGVIVTVAGTGTSGYTGDGGSAASATLNGPQDVIAGHDGGILIADSYNAVVRRIDRVGTITTFAGSEPGLSGDGGPATKAQLNLPTAVSVSSDRSVYVSDAANSRIRRVAPDGTIQTVAGFGGGSGLGGAGYGGDGGPADKAKAFSAMGLHLDAAGNLFIADSGNNRVRVVRNGTISTLAGTGAAGFDGDGGPAHAALLNTPQKIVVAPDGRVFVADRGNGRVRMIDRAGVISTVAGKVRN